MPRLQRKQEFLLVLATLPVAIRIILHQIPDQWLPVSVREHQLLTSILGGVFLTYFDAWIVWSYYRSPLNAFPTHDAGRDLPRMLFERPRGKTALKWMKEFPNADILHLRTRVGLPLLMPISPDGFRDILGQAQYSVEKPYGVRKQLSYVLGYGLIVSEGDQHKRQRKALTPAFSISNIRGLYPLMWKKAEEFSACVKREELQDGFVEIGEWASKLTLDIIGHAALSEDFKTMSLGTNDIKESFTHILTFTIAKSLHFNAGFILPQWFLTNLPFKFLKEGAYHCAVLRSRCNEVLASKKQALRSGQQDETDIMRDIISSGSFTDTEIVDQMLTFLAAGHETTASSLTWCCHLMALNPDIQLQLYQELYTSLSEDNISYQTLEALPYLNGVCEEVLRLYPAVPVTVREVLEETIICGVPVPQTTLIIITPYAVNRNPRFWGPDASECRPERWVDVSADGSRRPNKHGGTDSNLCGMTFLHGNRSCIGRDFAKAELRCAVASLFRKYEVSMWDPDETIKVVGTVTTKPDVGMKVKLKPRD